MIVGLPKEVKNNEHRVGLTPNSVKEITDNGHEVFVENNCGRIIRLCFYCRNKFLFRLLTKRYVLIKKL